MNRWLLSVAFLSVFFPSCLRALDQPGRPENIPGSPLAFRLSSGYLIEVEGRVGDQDHLKFILDTGASISILGQRIAQKLELDTHPAQSFNFDRNLQWQEGTVPEVQFGSVRAANVAVLVGDLARYSEFGAKADAIIGMDLLQLRNFTIDFGAGQLLFEPGPSRAYAAGGDPMTKCMTIDLQVQGHPVHLIVDTGSQLLLMYEDRLRKKVPELRTAGSLKNASMGGRVRVKQTILPDVVLGKRNHDVPVVFLPVPREDALPGIDGIVGVATLQARRVHFDFSQKSVTWE